MQKKLRKNGKRILCLSMAAIILLGSITGCSKKADNSVTSVESLTEITETERETQKPTETERETQKPTETERETQKPTETEGETQKPTETERETQKPTETERETQKPTETERETQKPTETERETQKPTETERETETPSQEETTSQENTEVSKYTVTMYNGSEKLQEIVVEKGILLGKINAPYIDGKIFLGWYYDSKLTDKVAADDILDKNITLYANYGDAMPLNEGGSPNYVSAVDQDKDFTIYVTVETSAERTIVSPEDVKAALKLTNVTSPEKTDDSRTLEKDVLVVANVNGDKYSVKGNGGFRAGDTYRLEIVDDNNIGLTFEGQTKDVRYYNFTIKKDEILNLSLDTGVKYLAAKELEKEYADNIMEYAGLYTAVKDENSDEIVYMPTNKTGEFRYKSDEYIAGDVIAVYVGTKPDERTLETSVDGEAVSYIEITKVVNDKDSENSIYSYKSANAADILFTPDIIPIDIDNGDGVSGWTEDVIQDAKKYFEIDNIKLDFTDEKYAAMGLGFDTVVETGDFVAFFSGEYGDKDAIQKGYGKITKVESGENSDTTKISYEIVSYDEVLAAMDIYKNSELTSEQLDSINEQIIVSTIKDQIIESGFAKEAGIYLATFAAETDEVKELLGENELSIKDCTITYSDGTPVPTDELMLMAADDAVMPKEPEVNVRVSRNLEHFDDGSGFRVEVGLTYAFDLKKKDGKNKIAINMTAVFETEVLLGFNVNGGAVWKTKWIFPYIYDYRMSGSIDQGLYTGIAITATAQLDEDEPENTFGPELLEPDGMGDYAQKIIDLSDSIKKMMEENNLAGEDESIGTASGGLIEKYEEFITAANDKWIDIIDTPLFAAKGSLDPFYVTAYSVDIRFVVSANMSVALGMSFQYEKSQRHTFTLMVLHKNESSTETVELSTERFQFDFYAMGTLGIRAGVRAKVLFGLLSTKIAGIGLQLETGAYARLWGYFYYCLSWEKNSDLVSAATGAILMEIGAYLEANLVMEVMNGTFSFNPSIYGNEWPIWHAGERENVLDFAYDDEGKWTEEENGREVEHSVPLSFDMLRVKSMEIPSEIFRMRYMDLKEGGEGYLTYDSKNRVTFNGNKPEFDDEERFFVEISEPAFSYNPITNMITVTPEEGCGSYEGTMTITWKRPDLTYASRTISRTFDITWTDPDSGYCLIFDTKGGSLIRTKVYGVDKDIEPVDDPTKVGYIFGGWYSDESCTVKAYIPEKMPKHDVTLYAKWIPAPNVYTVRHYYENLNYQYELLETTEQRKNTDGTDVLTDDILSQERIVNDNLIVPRGFEVNYDKTTVEDSVAPDGSTIVNIYYKRQIHSVTYSLGELTDEDNPDTTIRYRYGDTVFIPTYFMYGYTFAGWDRTGEPEPSDNTDNAQTIIMGIEDIKYVAKWNPNHNTPYYVEYYIYNPDENIYVMLGGDTGRIYNEGTTGDSVSVEKFLLDNTGYDLDKITVNGVDVGTDVTSKGKIDAYGKLKIAYFYHGMEFDIKYDLDGGTLLNADEVPVSYIHGITLDLTDVAAQKTGYKFIGWLECGQAITQIPSYRAGNVNLKAEWRAEKGEILLYDTDGVTQLGLVKTTYNQVVPMLGSTNIPSKPGYDFTGYYTEDGICYYDKSGNGMIVWDGAKNIKLKAVWTPAKVTIGFDLNGGNGDPIPAEGTYLDKYPVLPDDVTMPGYHLAGWILEGDISEAYVTTDTVIRSYESHKLVAQWEADTDTPYTVECYVEGGDSTEKDEVSDEPTEDNDSKNELQSRYTLYDTYKLAGTTGADVVVNSADYVLAGYEFDTFSKNNVLTGTISADGSTVFKLYYKQKDTEHYTVTFNYDRDDIETEVFVCNESYVTLPKHADTADHMEHIGWLYEGVYYDCNTSLEVNKSDNMELTAVWEKQGYKVNYWCNSRNFDEDRIVYSQQVDYDETVTVMDSFYIREPIRENNEDATDESSGGTEETFNKIIQYYEFTGWNTEKDGTGTTYLPGQEINNAGGLELYAQWALKDVPEGMVPYFVAFNVQDLQWTDQYNVDCNKSIMLFGEEGEDTDVKDYCLDGYTISKPIEQRKIVVGADANGKDYYIKGGVDGYTVVEIVYDADMGTVSWDFNGGISEKEWYTEGKYGEGNGIIQPTPKKDGYEFIGWNIRIPEYMGRKDIHAVAQYRKTDRRAVTVEYSMENLDGSGYTKASMETVYGDSGTTITPAPASFKGYVTPQAKTVVVADDNSTVCRYDYKRAEYTITWKLGVGTITGDTTDGDLSDGVYTQKIKYGASIKAPSLDKAGYKGSWKNVSQTMPAQDVTYEAEWTAQSVGYDVVFRRMKADGAYTYIGNTSYHRNAPADSVITISGDDLPDAFKGEVEKGYIKPLVQNVQIAADGSTIIYCDFDLVKSHLYYDFSGAVPTASNYALPGDYYYGTQLQIPSVSQLEKPGYTIEGWYDVSDPDKKLVEGNFITIGDKNVTYKLKCTPITYNITYDLVYDNAENPNNPSRYRMGLDFNISGAVCDNKAFVEWKWNLDSGMPEGIKKLDNGLMHVTKDAIGNLGFKAVWTDETKLFTAILFEGSSETYTYFYPKESARTITLAKIVPPNRLGYIFSYWTKKVPKTGEGESGYYKIVLDNDNTKVSTLNVNTDFLTANWMMTADRNDGQGKMIYVSDRTELELAAEYLRNDSEFTQIVLLNDIELLGLERSVIDVLDDGQVLDGNDKTITFTGAATLVNENRGTIRNLHIAGGADNTVCSASDMYFGLVTNVNNGTIENCSIAGIETEDGYTNTYVRSNAQYFGSFAGFNAGVIKDCNINHGNISWKNEKVLADKCYAGGFAGYNDSNGEITGCTANALYVTIQSVDDRKQSGKIYLGGVSGMSCGRIENCVIRDSRIGYDTYADGIDEEYCGGFVGIDAEQTSISGSINASGVYSCRIENTQVYAKTAAGGLIGECNYSVAAENEMDNVYVYSKDGYAGHIMGINRSVVSARAYNYISNAKTATENGSAGVIAGLGTGKRPSDVDGLYATVNVYARDNNTKVIEKGNNRKEYRKGIFEYIFVSSLDEDGNGVRIRYREGVHIVG